MKYCLADWIQMPNWLWYGHLITDIKPIDKYQFDSCMDMIIFFEETIQFLW